MRAIPFAALVLLACLAFAQEASPPPILDSGEWNLELYTAQGQLPPDSIVWISYSVAEGKEFSTVLASKGMESSFYPAKTPSKAKIAYDLPSTPSIDYVWEGNWDFSYPNARILLQPVSELAGTVSNQDGPAAGGTLVELSCNGGFYGNATASATGTFSFPRIPAGKCSISAQSGASKAASVISLSAGEFKTMELKLENSTFPYAEIAGFLVLAAAAGWLIFSKYKKPPARPSRASAARPKKQTSSPIPPASAISARQKDLLSTLNEKEKSIVEFVQRHHPSAIRVSKVRAGLLMPKTSFTRTLQALERKQFVATKKEGSRLFAKLHGFFLRG